MVNEQAEPAPVEIGSVNVGGHEWQFGTFPSGGRGDVARSDYDELVRIVDKIRALSELTPRAMDRDEVASFLNDIANIVDGDA